MTLQRGLCVIVVVLIGLAAGRARAEEQKVYLRRCLRDRATGSLPFLSRSEEELRRSGLTSIQWVLSTYQEQWRYLRIWTAWDRSDKDRLLTTILDLRDLGSVAETSHVRVARLPQDFVWNPVAPELCLIQPGLGGSIEKFGGLEGASRCRVFFENLILMAKAQEGGDLRIVGVAPADLAEPLQAWRFIAILTPVRPADPALIASPSLSEPGQRIAISPEIIRSGLPARYFGLIENLLGQYSAFAIGPDGLALKSRSAPEYKIFLRQLSTADWALRELQTPGRAAPPGWVGRSRLCTYSRDLGVSLSVMERAVWEAEPYSFSSDPEIWALSQR